MGYLTKCTQSCDCGPMIGFERHDNEALRSQLTRHSGNEGLRLKFDTVAQTSPCCTSSVLFRSINARPRRRPVCPGERTFSG